MTVYEMRTYTLHVGKMAEAVKLYTEFGYPALQTGGQDKTLIGYFQADTGMINQLVHLWKFHDDADRRAHWASVFANKDFVEGFAAKFRPQLDRAPHELGPHGQRRVRARQIQPAAVVKSQPHDADEVRRVAGEPAVARCARHRRALRVGDVRVVEPRDQDAAPDR